MTHKPNILRLLTIGTRGFRDPRQLVGIHEEYKRLKKRSESMQQEQEEEQQ